MGRIFVCLQRRWFETEGLGLFQSVPFASTQSFVSLWAETVQQSQVEAEAIPMCRSLHPIYWLACSHAEQAAAQHV